MLFAWRAAVSPGRIHRNASGAFRQMHSYTPAFIGPLPAEMEIGKMEDVDFHRSLF